MAKATTKNSVGGANAAVLLTSEDERAWDFKAARDAGIRAVMHRATAGTSGPLDTKYTARKQATTGHVLWGAFHVGENADGAAQADHFLEQAALDDSMGAALLIKGTSITLEQVRQFVGRVQTRLTRPPILISDGTLRKLIDKLVDPELRKCFLWIDQVGGDPAALLPTGWKRWRFWTYTDGTQGPEPHRIQGIGRAKRTTVNLAGSALASLWSRARLKKIEAPETLTIRSGSAPRFTVATEGFNAADQARIKWLLTWSENGVARSFTLGQRGTDVSWTIPAPPGSATLTALGKGVSSPSETLTVEVHTPIIPTGSRIEFRHDPERVSGHPVVARFAGAKTSEWFVVGKRQPWSYVPKGETTRKHFLGLFLTGDGAPEHYDPSVYVGSLGHWAHIIGPTATAEGLGSFAALNTYDNASFSFGFVQFGGHTHAANLHTLLVNLIRNHAANAAVFLPGFAERAGELLAEAVALTSETDKENVALRRHIKPDDLVVTRREAEFGARLVYWARFFPELKAEQVALAVAQARKGIFEKVKGKARIVEPAEIHGASDRVFAWVFDILNHGVAGISLSEIREAMLDPKPEEKLSKLYELKKKTEDRYAEKRKRPKPAKGHYRADHLKGQIDGSAAFGKFFDSTKPEGQEFVPDPPAPPPEPGEGPPP